VFRTSKVLAAVILTPIVLGGLLLRAIKHRLRPETSFLLLSSSPPHFDPSRFQSVVWDVRHDAAIRLESGAMTATVGALTLRAEVHSSPMTGIGAYRVDPGKAESALKTHQGWISILVSAPSADQDMARSFAAKVCAQLVDHGTTAVWNSDTATVQAVDERTISNLAAGLTR
jgi:hypothetical protein